MASTDTPLHNEEKSLEMSLHAVIIGFIAYLIMVFLLKQDEYKAEKHSIIIGATSLIYMLLWGHSLPPFLK